MTEMREVGFVVALEDIEKARPRIRVWVLCFL